jgi:hypothetical protein
MAGGNEGVRRGGPKRSQTNSIILGGGGESLILGAIQVTHILDTATCTYMGASENMLVDCLRPGLLDVGVPVGVYNSLQLEHRRRSA